MLKPLKAEDLYKLSSPMNSSKSLSLHNITVILNKMEQLLLPEIISLELVRVSDITRSDSISDVEQHLSEEITSVISKVFFLLFFLGGSIDSSGSFIRLS